LKKTLLFLKSENEGQIYNLINEKLSFVKYLNNFDLNISKDIKKIDLIIIGASLLAWRKSSTKKIDGNIKSFAFNNSTIHESKDLIWTEQNIDLDKETIYQAWIKNERLDEILEKWKIPRILECYAEPLCFSFSGTNRYWFSGNLKLCLSHNQRAAEISASNVLPSKDILPADLVFSPQGAKFLINKKQNIFVDMVTSNVVFWPIIIILFLITLGSSGMYLKFKKEHNYTKKNIEHLQKSIKPKSLDSFYRLAPHLSNGSLKSLKIKNSGNDLSLELTLPPKISNKKIKEIFIQNEIKILRSKNLIFIDVKQKSNE